MNLSDLWAVADENFFDFSKYISTSDQRHSLESDTINILIYYLQVMFEGFTIRSSRFSKTTLTEVDVEGDSHEEGDSTYGVEEDEGGIAVPSG